MTPLPVWDKTCLALDLGTHTGHAFNPGGRWGPHDIGTWELGSAGQIKNWKQARWDRRRDPRVVTLANTLRNAKPNIVIFEDVQFSSYTLQCQLWASLRAAVWLAFPNDPIVIDCVPVSTLKKFATGHGGATKAGMCKALIKKFPGTFTPAKHPEKVLWHRPDWQPLLLDDNAVDAFWLWLWAFDKFPRMS